MKTTIQKSLRKTVLLSLLSRKISTICSSSLSLKLVDPFIKVSINLSTVASFNVARIGDTSKFFVKNHAQLQMQLAELIKRI